MCDTFFGSGLAEHVTREDKKLKSLGGGAEIRSSDGWWEGVDDPKIAFRSVLQQRTVEQTRKGSEKEFEHEPAQVDVTVADLLFWNG